MRLRRGIVRTLDSTPLPPARPGLPVGLSRWGVAVPAAIKSRRGRPHHNLPLPPARPGLAAWGVGRSVGAAAEPAGVAR